MDKQDSMLMRAIAEVAFNGYTDAYGNRVDTMSQIMNKFKPSEEFYKKLEKNIDYEKVAEKIIEKITNFSSYDRDSFATEIATKVKEIVSQKLAAKMLEDMSNPPT